MIKIKPIIPKGSKLRVSVYKRAIDRTLDLMDTRTKGLYRKAVQTWKGPPSVDSIKQEFSRIVVVDSPVFDYVDQGTRAHRIRARRGRFLRFGSSFRAKSSPNSLVSTPGGSSGSPVFAREVQHPGTKARNYTKKIQKIADEEFPRIFSAVVAEETR
jgi:hypothetical protein